MVAPTTYPFNYKDVSQAQEPGAEHRAEARRHDRRAVDGAHGECRIMHRARFAVGPRRLVAAARGSGAGGRAQTLTAPDGGPGQGLFDRSHDGTQSLDVSVRSPTRTTTTFWLDGGATASRDAGRRRLRRRLHGRVVREEARARRRSALSEGSTIRYYPSARRPRRRPALGERRRRGSVRQRLGQRRSDRSSTGRSSRLSTTPPLFDAAASATCRRRRLTRRRSERNQRSYSSHRWSSARRIGRRTSLSVLGDVRRTDFLERLGLETTASGRRSSDAEVTAISASSAGIAIRGRLRRRRRRSRSRASTTSMSASTTTTRWGPRAERRSDSRPAPRSDGSRSGRRSTG